MKMNNTPILRFNSFSKDWESKPLEQIADVKQGFPFNSKTYTKKGNYNIITISNVGGDRYLRKINEVNKIKKLPNGIQQHQILKDNDILVSMTGNVGRVSLNTGENNLLNQRVDVVIPKNIDNEFLFQTLSLSRFENEMNIAAQGAAQLNISNSDVEKYMISLPEKSEQIKIGQFLFNIQKNIDSKKSKLDKFMNYKKEMLLKMFPTDSTVPELRFDSFSKEWNSCVFGETFSKLSNNSYSRDLLNYKEGRAKDIHYGDILIKFGSSIDVENIEVPFINNDIDISSIKRENHLITGDIVFADTAEDETAGKMVEIINNNNICVLSGLHTYPCRPNIKFYPGFLGICLNTVQFHNKLTKYMQGTKVTGFNYEFLSRLDFLYPELPEQEKIVKFFNNLDSVILGLNKEIDILTHLKESISSKMLV